MFLYIHSTQSQKNSILETTVAQTKSEQRIHTTITTGRHNAAICVKIHMLTNVLVVDGHEDINCPLYT